MKYYTIVSGIAGWQCSPIFPSNRETIPLNEITNKVKELIDAGEDIVCYTDENTARAAAWNKQTISWGYGFQVREFISMVVAIELDPYEWLEDGPFENTFKVNPKNIRFTGVYALTNPKKEEVVWVNYGGCALL